MNLPLRMLVAFLLLCAAGASQAHKLSDSYLSLRLGDKGIAISGRVDLTRRRSVTGAG